MRNLLRLGSTAVTLLLMMFVGGIVLWIVIPVGWLWVGSQMQVLTGSLAAALGIMLLGVIVSITLMMPLLGWLSDRHRASRIARGLDDTGHLALEMVLASSATIALVTFGGWFLLLSGSSPIPFSIRF